MTADTPSPSEVELLPCGHCGTAMVNHGHCFSHPRPASGDCILRHYSFDINKADKWNTRASSTRSSTVDEATVETAALRELLQPLVEKAVRYDRAREVWGTNYHDGFTVGVSLGTCRKVRAAIASLPSAAVGWQPIEKYPRGEFVERYHRQWECYIAVRQNDNDPSRWIEKTLTTVWPDEAFLPGWRPLPEPPASLPSVAVQPIGERE